MHVALVFYQQFACVGSESFCKELQKEFIFNKDVNYGRVLNSTVNGLGH